VDIRKLGVIAAIAIIVGTYFVLDLGEYLTLAYLQASLLAGTVVYVNAGAQIAQLETLRGLLSPNLIGAFLLLALFPWIARGILRFVRRRAVYRGWSKPTHFDRNQIVIGAGSAGLVTAYIGAAVKARVTLIEKECMGGDCLNTGCVPSKALIKSARVMHQTAHLERYGIRPVRTAVDFPAAMARVHRVIRKIEPHDSIERYRKLGVDCRIGHARLLSPLGSGDPGRWYVGAPDSAQHRDRDGCTTDRSVDPGTRSDREFRSVDVGYGVGHPRASAAAACARWGGRSGANCRRRSRDSAVPSCRSRRASAS
jgi:hypothetical protein